MECACNGFKDRQDYIDYLKKISNFLEEDGILLLSVDNWLGLKYFCGARESHGSNAFERSSHYITLMAPVVIRLTERLEY